MIGDKVILEGAPFRVEHVRCKQGLVHTVLRVTRDRRYAPHHEYDGAVYHAEWTNTPVLTCFTCINHVWQDTPMRDRFSDVDEDGSVYEDDDD